MKIQEKGKGLKFNVQYELSMMTTDWSTIENTIHCIKTEINTSHTKYLGGGGQKPIRSSQKETKPAGTTKGNQFCIRTGGKFSGKYANVMFHISCFFIRKFIIIRSSKCGILR